jgi:hypothetical protein
MRKQPRALRKRSIDLVDTLVSQASVPMAEAFVGGLRLDGENTEVLTILLYGYSAISIDVQL